MKEDEVKKVKKVKKVKGKSESRFGTIIMHSVRSDGCKRNPQRCVREVEGKNDEQHHPPPWIDSILVFILLRVVHLYTNPGLHAQNRHALCLMNVSSF